MATLYYVIKKPHGGYVVWETTPSKIFELSSQNQTLAGRLDRSPFATRAEADQRCQALNAKVAGQPGGGGGKPKRRRRLDYSAVTVGVQETTQRRVGDELVGVCIHLHTRRSARCGVRFGNPASLYDTRQILRRRRRCLDTILLRRTVGRR